MAPSLSDERRLSYRSLSRLPASSIPFCPISPRPLLSWAESRHPRQGSPVPFYAETIEVNRESAGLLVAGLPRWMVHPGIVQCTTCTAVLGSPWSLPSSAWPVSSAAHSATSGVNARKTQKLSKDVGAAKCWRTRPLAAQAAFLGFLLPFSSQDTCYANTQGLTHNGSRQPGLASQTPPPPPPHPHCPPLCGVLYRGRLGGDPGLLPFFRAGRDFWGGWECWESMNGMQMRC